MPMRLRRAARIILVGAPGMIFHVKSDVKASRVGKGTQADRLLARFPQLSSISSGNLLRENVKKQTSLGIQAESTMRSGALVPDLMIMRLILSELEARGWVRHDPEATNKPTSDTRSKNMASNNTASTLDRLRDESHHHTDAGYLHGSVSQLETSDEPAASFILDGFPRTVSQATALDAMIPINLVVSLRTPVAVILDRISNRWIHGPSGRVYNTTFNRPKTSGKDDVTGEPLTKRDDDNETTWKSRLEQFEETSRPLLEHYRKKGLLWEVEGDSSDAISPKLFMEVERRFAM